MLLKPFEAEARRCSLMERLKGLLFGGATLCSIVLFATTLGITTGYAGAGPAGDSARSPVPPSPTIKVGPTTAISGDSPLDPLGECFLAINPRNAANMIATALVTGNEGHGSVVYVTHDSGRTWHRVIFSAGDRVTSSGRTAKGWDAITYFDGEGVGYFACNDGDGLWIWRSKDEGRSWTSPTLVAGAEGFDRQFMAFDHTGRFRGRVYAAASVSTLDLEGKPRPALAIALSTDGGQSFGQPTILGSTEREDIFALAGMQVAPDGTLVFPFSTLTRTDPADGGISRLRVATSGDGGKTYSISPPIVNFRMATGYRAQKTLGGISSAIDLSTGPRRGWIYIVWPEMTDKGHDIKVVHSADLGRTWSNPVVVNDNREPGDHANPAIAVNKDGVVGVVWNDRRHHPGKDLCYELYFSASRDGGETFLPNVGTGQAPTCPSAPGNWVPAASIIDYPRLEGGKEVHGQGLNILMISTRFPNGGETQGLVADPDGVFHAAWIDGSSGVMQLALTTFTVPPASGPSTVQRDVSVQVKLEVEECRFDWTAKTMTCRMHLENRSAQAVRGPFTVVLREQRVNLIGFEVQGADNQLPSVGASWRFEVPGRGDLSPGGKSPSREFTWRFTGIPEEPEYPFLMFTILAGPPGS